MASVAAQLPAGTQLQHWMLGAPLGKGAFGFVYEARSASNPSLVVALKVAALKGYGANKLKKGSQSRDAALLYKEYLLYTVHFKKPTSPHLITLPPNAYGEDPSYRWLAMQRLGRTLNSHLKEDCVPSCSAPWPTVALVAVQLVEALQYVHSKQHVYVDLNADNVMTGLSGSATPDVLYLVDFGLAEAYRGVLGEAKPATENGTPLFSSRSCASGGAMSPLDDLESLAYLLMYCLGGAAALPWGAAASAAETLALKKAATPASILACLDSARPQAPALPASALAALRALLAAALAPRAAASAPAPSSSSGGGGARIDYASLINPFRDAAAKSLVWSEAPAAAQAGGAAASKRKASPATAKAASPGRKAKAAKSPAADAAAPPSRSRSPSSSSSKKRAPPPKRAAAAAADVAAAEPGAPSSKRKAGAAVATATVKRGKKAAGAAADRVAAPAPARRKRLATASSSSSKRHLASEVIVIPDSEGDGGEDIEVPVVDEEEGVVPADVLAEALGGPLSEDESAPSSHEPNPLSRRKHSSMMGGAAAASASSSSSSSSGDAQAEPPAKRRRSGGVEPVAASAGSSCTASPAFQRGVLTKGLSSLAATLGGTVRVGSSEGGSKDTAAADAADSSAAAAAAGVAASRPRKARKMSR